MSVQVQWSALKQTKWHEYLLRFVLGGAITLAAGLLAGGFGPEFGGLFLAFPAIFPASATLLEKHEREKKRRKGINATRRGREAAALDGRGAVLGGIALIVFALAVWKVLPHHNAVATILGAVLVWLGVSTTLWVIQRKY